MIYCSVTGKRSYLDRGLLYWIITTFYAERPYVFLLLLLFTNIKISES